MNQQFKQSEQSTPRLHLPTKTRVLESRKLQPSPKDPVPLVLEGSQPVVANYSQLTKTVAGLSSKTPLMPMDSYSQELLRKKIAESRKSLP